MLQHLLGLSSLSWKSDNVFNILEASRQQSQGVHAHVARGGRRTS